MRTRLTAIMKPPTSPPRAHSQPPDSTLREIKIKNFTDTDIQSSPVLPKSIAGDSTIGQKRELPADVNEAPDVVDQQLITPSAPSPKKCRVAAAPIPPKSLNSSTDEHGRFVDSGSNKVPSPQCCGKKHVTLDVPAEDAAIMQGRFSKMQRVKTPIMDVQAKPSGDDYKRMEQVAKKTMGHRNTSTIVFTDDEEAEDLGDDVNTLTEDGFNVFTDDEEARDSDNAFIDDSAVVDDDALSGSEFDTADSHVPSPDLPHHASGGHVATAKGKGKRISWSPSPSPSTKMVASLDIQAELFEAARKESLESIARTNPGDGSKRLYSEETFIHSSDEIVGEEPSKRVHKAQPETLSSHKAKDNVVYLEDTEPRGESSPSVCGVANKDNEDHILTYNNLPPLQGGKSFLLWSMQGGPGLVIPSAWPEQIGNMSMSQLRAVLQFSNYKTFINPSRVSPSLMGRAPATGNAYLVVPGHNQSFLTCTTAIMTTACNIVRPKEVFGEQRRTISGIPHNYEYQRMEACILQGLHEDTAHAQLAQDAITFSTARNLSALQSMSPAKNPSKMFRQPAGVVSGGTVFACPRANLQGMQTVPVLDARCRRFNLSTNLPVLDELLPPFKQEVPDGSCAWIGYTVNKYNTAKGANINFNLLWVVVLGTPE